MINSNLITEPNSKMEYSEGLLYGRQSQTLRLLAHAENPHHKELRLTVGKLEKELGKELRKKLGNKHDMGE
jgi:hypothetical protein